MSEHLLLVALGPVQDFIAQARRTRDLWFGSHVLSELSRAAARALADGGARLIFPALDKDDLKDAAELKACKQPLRQEGENKGQPPVTIANKILAEIPEGIDAKEKAVEARATVLKFWRSWADEIKAERRGLLAEDVRDTGDVWCEQIDEVVEFYAAWAPLGEHDYGPVRKRVEEVLAGRKGLRDFRPILAPRPGAPKSSLDGARVSVLSKNRTHHDFSRYRIGPGEQLDAVGVVKRTGGEPEQFVPILNVAAGVWLEQAAKREDCWPLVQQLSDACRAIQIGAVKRPDIRVAQAFEFDASVFYPSRWPSLFEELGRPAASESRRQAHEVARVWGEANVNPLLAKMRRQDFGAPPSYVACLVADGDNMGKTINALETADQNRKLSKALANFPKRAREIVEQEHLGSLIYAGGDDVLAFVPVAEAVQCAAKLSDAFQEEVRGKLPPKVPVPTLSVGIGVGHVMESMTVLLELGRQGEREAKAKPDKNSLAIIVDKRSGGKLKWVEMWDSDPLKRLQDDAKMLAAGREGGNGLSVGKVHELGKIVRRALKPELLERGDLSAGTVGNYRESGGPALLAYANGALAQSGSGSGGGVRLEQIGLRLQNPQDYAETHRELARAVDRLLLVKALRESGFGRDSGSTREARA